MVLSRAKIFIKHNNTHICKIKMSGRPKHCMRKYDKEIKFKDTQNILSLDKEITMCRKNPDLFNIFQDYSSKDVFAPLSLRNTIVLKK